MLTVREICTHGFGFLFQFFPLVGNKKKFDEFVSFMSKIGAHNCGLHLQFLKAIYKHELGTAILL